MRVYVHPAEGGFAVTIMRGGDEVDRAEGFEDEYDAVMMARRTAEIVGGRLMLNDSPLARRFRKMTPGDLLAA